MYAITTIVHLNSQTRAGRLTMNKTPQMARLAILSIVAAVFGWIFISAGAASAAPIPAGTTPVVASMEACNGDSFDQWISCGAAFTNDWLQHEGSGDVVEATVTAPSLSLGLWPSATTGGVCGFVEVGGIGFGMHHCDRVSFVSAASDPHMVTSKIAGIVALSHESGHGMQEKAGLDPVATTLQNTSGPQLFPYEQSSDCWAGAAFSWYIQQGMLSGNDVPAAMAFIASIGIEGEAGHGSPSQRQAAFNNGLNGGSAACNAYFPGQHVFPSS